MATAGKARDTTPFEQYLAIREEIQKGNFYPFYAFCGDEIFFVNQLLQELGRRVVPEAERDFNQTDLFATSENSQEILAAARRAPLGGERTYLLVREAQEITSWDVFLSLYKNPNKRSIIALQFNGAVKKSKQASDLRKVLDIIESEGVFFDSESVRYRKDQWNKIVEHIASLSSCKIDSAATAVLQDMLGNSLLLVDNEIRKIASVLPADKMLITPDNLRDITPNKEFAWWDLTDAIIHNDINRALYVLYYIAANDRKSEAVLSLNGALYRYFQNVFVWGILKKTTPNEKLIEILGLHKAKIKEMEQAALLFSPIRCAKIFSRLRQFDGQQKGLGGVSNMSTYEALKQLLLQIITH